MQASQGHRKAFVHVCFCCVWLVRLGVAAGKPPVENVSNCMGTRFTCFVVRIGDQAHVHETLCSWYNVVDCSLLRDILRYVCISGMSISHDVIACNITKMEYWLLWYGFLATPSTPRCPLVLLVQPSSLFYIYFMGFPLVPRIWYRYYAVRCYRYSYDGTYGYFD